MDLSPKQIVYRLDKYIIGQDAAKKAVAIALRNRYRRAQLPVEIREEITPKNIIMKGPTGVGKTEIARRLAKLVTLNSLFDCLTRSIKRVQNQFQMLSNSILGT